MRMQRPRALFLVAFFAAAAMAYVGSQPTAAPVETTTAATSSPADPETKKLETMAARFAPVDLAVDISALPPNERQALAKMVEASRVMDSLFLRQVWVANEKTLQDLSRDTSPLGRARLHYFTINKGPWSR